MPEEYPNQREGALCTRNPERDILKMRNNTREWSFNMDQNLINAGNKEENTRENKTNIVDKIYLTIS